MISTSGPTGAFLKGVRAPFVGVIKQPKPTQTKRFMAANPNKKVTKSRRK